MLTLASLAVRNVTRNKARSAITVGAIGFSVLMTVLLAGFVGGLMNLIVDDAVNARVGALQVHRKGYSDAREGKPLTFDLPEKGELLDKIRAVPGVTAVAPRLEFSGLLSNGSSGTMFMASGIDPALDPAVLPDAMRGVEGAPVSAEQPRGGVVGFELAQALDVKPGSSLTVQASTRSGKENALDLDVAGTLNNGNALDSKRVATVPLAYAQELLGMDGRATEYVVAVADRDRVEAVAQAVRQALGAGYEVQTWQELRPAFADMIRYQGLVLALISVVFLVIAVIGVVNTMLMSVLERTREIGTMMAVGVRRGRIALLFLLEALAQALLGSGAGIALACLVLKAVEWTGGFPFATPGGTASVFLVPVVRPDWVVGAVVGSTVGALVAAFYPSVRAARLRPVEALRAV